MSKIDNPLLSLLTSLIENKLLSYGIDFSIMAEHFYYWLDVLWYLCLSSATIFLLGVIYFSNKVIKIRRWEHDRVYGHSSLLEEVAEGLQITPPKKNQDWEKILNLIGSDNPNDWKLAIIEADKILEMIVNNFSVPGDNLGDKLKHIEKSDFTNLDAAWQAHKIRNRIAHEHNFHLSQREARLAIDNFEKVFVEFDFI